MAGAYFHVKPNLCASPWRHVVGVATTLEFSIEEPKLTTCCTLSVAMTLVNLLRTTAQCLCIVAALSGCTGTPGSAAAEQPARDHAQTDASKNHTLEFITFDDIKPENTTLQECWGGIGIDKSGWVYAAFSDYGAGRLDDTVLFRFHSETRERELLGTLRGISAAADNAHDDEGFAKVHVAFIEHKNKMYFASHDFHDIAKDYSDMGEHRGGHFYSFDLQTERFEDLSRHEPQGVSVLNQGIIATDILRAHDKLVGFTFPLGDVLIHDLANHHTTRFPGVPQYRRKNVSRYIIATRKGKVFFAYQRDDFWLYELDVATGAMRRTAAKNIIKRGAITATATTSDERYVYFTDLSGRLYSFDTSAEELTELGFILTKEERARGKAVRRLGSLALSIDETRLYAMPYGFKDGSAPALYEFDLNLSASTKLTTLEQFPSATVKGSGVTDANGMAYFCLHEEKKTSARLFRFSTAHQ